VKFFFFFFFVGLGLELGFTFARQALYCLNLISSLFCSGYYFGDGGLVNCFSELALNQDPPDLSLPSS
jgi:hypothetical protein